MTRDFAAFFGPFGYLEVLRKRSDDPGKPVGQRTSLEWMTEVNLAIVGTPDDVKRGIHARPHT